MGKHWVWLYPMLLSAFERLRKSGVKMSSRLILKRVEHDIYDKTFQFTDKCFVDLVTTRRIQDFTDRHGIFYRRFKGKNKLVVKSSARFMWQWLNISEV
ncbi:hypothetical protein JG687_00012506 [Phytophthora cactorum]|uniref:Uncharacterized protein n=1 Tax=Phytophthora cactorum TaxID=29920 RepID=A0A8T1U6Z2_9STRA|nr:hypothetical protein JG687_00012506 [Phytophthora cactorum]